MKIFRKLSCGYKYMKKKVSVAETRLGLKIESTIIETVFLLFLLAFRSLQARGL